MLGDGTKAVSFIKMHIYKNFGLLDKSDLSKYKVNLAMGKAVPILYLYSNSELDMKFVFCILKNVNLVSLKIYLLG